VIQALSNEISNNLGINIRSFSIEGNAGFFEGKISIFVLNKDQLNQVVHALENLEWISSVERTDKKFK
jgi:guanosine-3',5'-bis(diphosphate) 3'-pyrophosphohydrolase